MLKFSYLYEDYALAAKALSLWMESGARESLDWFRISANAVYAVRDPRAGMRFLRMAPASEKRLSWLRAESDFLSHLASRGYPAARMLPSLGGATVETLPYNGEAWYASYFEGAPGDRSDRIEWTDEIAFRYGEALAKLHVFSREYPADAPFRTYEDALDRAWEVFRAAKREEALFALDALGKALSALPKANDTFGVLHYDFEPDNVFFKDGMPCVIDFESGLRFFYPADVMIALDSLDDAVPEDRLDWARARVLEGYESVTPLDRDLMARRELRAFYDARGLAQTLYCLSDPPKEDEPEWAVELRAKLLDVARFRERNFIDGMNDRL